MNLGNLDGVSIRTLPIRDGERGRPAHRMRDMVDVVRTVEVLAVPAEREDHAGPDPAGTGRLGKTLRVQLGIETRRVGVSLEIRAREAPVAALCGFHTQPAGRSAVRITREHAESLYHRKRLDSYKVSNEKKKKKERRKEGKISPA